MSSSLVKRPLPPASESGRSWIASPVVLMIDRRQVLHAPAMGGDQPVLRLVGLGEGERASPRADDQGG